MHITKVRRGPTSTGPNLSKAELTALALMANGMSQKNAAHQMDISQRTYRRLLTDAATRLRANGPVHALCLAVSVELLVPDQEGLGFHPHPIKARAR